MPSSWVHCDLNVRILEGSDGYLCSRLALPVRSPSPRKCLYLKLPGDTRTTAWACATCLLFENFLPVASYSRRVSDLKVPNLSSKALRCHISLKTYDLKFTLLWERASMRWLLMRALEKQLQHFTEMITIRSFIFLTIYVPILRVWMGEDKGQLSVKILAICQLLVKF